MSEPTHTIMLRNHSPPPPPEMRRGDAAIAPPATCALAAVFAPSDLRRWRSDLDSSSSRRGTPSAARARPFLRRTPPLLHSPSLSRNSAGRHGGRFEAVLRILHVNHVWSRCLHAASTASSAGANTGVTVFARGAHEQKSVDKPHSFVHRSRFTCSAGNWPPF
ncbi:hypothetical protein B0H19DRAFT_1065803 [Mycena capillaripes]|nr:hypothetical protein B0H19DRAFT_1065803 [Mycena capillaripes]